MKTVNLQKLLHHTLELTVRTECVPEGEGMHRKMVRCRETGIYGSQRLQFVAFSLFAKALLHCLVVVVKSNIDTYQAMNSRYKSIEQPV